MKFDSLKTRVSVAIAILMIAFNLMMPILSLAASAKVIDRDATASLNKLYKHTPDAKKLADKAVGILIFPDIVKGGFIIAGQYGDGALRKKGKTVAYYRSLAASYGFQAGAQAFGYVLFFMDEDSLRYLDKSEGFELGTGPSFVVLDSGFDRPFLQHVAKRHLSVHLRPKGLMGGFGIQGTKIAKSTRSVEAPRNMWPNGGEWAKVSVFSCEDLTRNPTTET
jgi:lipid-binding SYLF domain-containing protein